jgi:precorrin-2 dehydrogenase/sirohydrochlorin ferrochelatase
MPLFPLFLKLDRRPCLVVGAGPVGEGKIEGLLLAGAKVRVIAPKATRAIVEWARVGAIEWEARGFLPTDLDGAFLVIAAAASPDLHERIFHEAQLRGVLCNVVDEPERCDFYYPAVVRRGHLQIAISTGGQNPALAQSLRQKLEQQFGPEWEAWVEQLGEARRKVRATVSDADERRQILHRLASGEPAGGKA